MSPQMRMRGAGAFALVLLMCGCATGQMGANYRPIIDSKSVDFNQYEADLKECQAYATRTQGAGEAAMTGAAVGAVIGGVLAAAAGSRYDRGATARVGGVSGAIGAGAEAEKNQRDIIRRCLGGRGYKVLQ